MKNRQINIYKAIDEILWKDWDPIGINDNENCRDEYQGYVSHIYNLIIHDADKTKITNHLLEIETINMGMEGNKNHCEEIAKKILNQFKTI